MVDGFVAFIEAHGVIAAGENDPFDAGNAGRLEKIIGADDVGVEEGFPIAFNGISTQMNDTIDAGNGILGGLRVAQISLYIFLIRAAIAGTLGDVAEHLGAGSFVNAGEKFCAIVPSGAKHVVAEFEPSRALGRIREGQAARLRLDGYPWTQYGTVQATVNRVASVIRNGHVRVELVIDEVPPGIVLEHGLPGQLEVEVETSSPAILVLRSVGKLVEGA